MTHRYEDMRAKFRRMSSSPTWPSTVNVNDVIAALDLVYLPPRSQAWQIDEWTHALVEYGLIDRKTQQLWADVLTSEC